MGAAYAALRTAFMQGVVGRGNNDLYSLEICLRAESLLHPRALARIVDTRVSAQPPYQRLVMHVSTFRRACTAGTER